MSAQSLKGLSNVQYSTNFLRLDRFLADRRADVLYRADAGVGPTVVLVDEGVAKNLSSTTLRDDAYAFIFSQQGLMAGVSIEGTKISRIRK